MYIAGTVILKENDMLLVKTGGIGYKIRTTKETARAATLNKEVALFTHLAVREDAMELYGFKTKDELNFFEKLVSVSGIGPKSALAILNLAPVSKLVNAIASSDAHYLTKVSGIGKKSAAKIILELKDTVSAGISVIDEQELAGEKDALLALQSLGYGMNEAREALLKVKRKDGTVESAIKEALKLLSR